MKLHLTFILFLFGLTAQAQHVTKILSTNIRTLRARYLSEALEPNGNPQRPYLLLQDGVVDGSEAENTLEISFDELSHDAKQYSYRVLHCNRDWSVSDISSYEYLDGFTTGDVVNYELSLNTQQAYTHYWLEFPNADMQLKASGNYLLQVYQDGDPEQVVAQVCFMVVEPMAEIDAKVRANTDIELSGRYQQLDIDLLTNSLNIRDPQDVKVVVQQNGRLDNVITLAKPTFVEPRRLRYINNPALIFEAGNEFRHFDAYSAYYAGYHVDVVDYEQGEYHVLLDMDEIRGAMGKGAGREGLPYMTELDANGQWIVNCEKTDFPDIEAEYMWVHFCLPVPYPLMDARVFIGGDLFYNQFTSTNMMHYDAERKCYFARAYLKQGGYNYMYYAIRTNDKIQTRDSQISASLLPLEGSHWQTQNEYLIKVYYRPFGTRYDQLIGIKRL